MGKKYRSGSISKAPNGKWDAYILHEGKRQRRRFDREGQAKAWIDGIEPSLDSNLPPLTSAELIDAASARHLLPEGISLVECARFWISEQGASEVVEIKKATEIFLGAKRRAGLRQRTLQDYEYRLGKLLNCKSIADQLHKVSVAQLEDALRDVDDPTSRDNYRRVWRALFNFGIRRGWLRKNPCDALESPRRDKPLPEFLRPEEVQSLFNHASIEIQAELAIGFFAGLRSAEIDRMTWASVREEHIVVSSAMAKARRQRYVEIVPNLRAWLDQLNPGKPEERICRGLKLERQRMKKAMLKAAGIRWPHNAARHSYATYHLALHQDPGRTSLMLGHQSQALLFEHYRGLATKEEAEAFFGIVPRKDGPPLKHDENQEKPAPTPRKRGKTVRP